MRWLLRPGDEAMSCSSVASELSADRSLHMDCCRERDARCASSTMSCCSGVSGRGNRLGEAFAGVRSSSCIAGSTTTSRAGDDRLTADAKGRKFGRAANTPRALSASWSSRVSCRDWAIRALNALESERVELGCVSCGMSGTCVNGCESATRTRRRHRVGGNIRGELEVAGLQQPVQVGKVELLWSVSGGDRRVPAASGQRQHPARPARPHTRG